MDFRNARERMVATQIAARGVRDARVLDAMREVPRERFVPVHLAEQAYADRPLPIGERQTISQPYIVALMTELLAVADTHDVLEIGTGSGYQTAILARLAKRVISIERHASLAETARATLVSLGYENVEVIVADGSAGHPAAAPYSRILVTAGAPSIPDALEAQLADGGRLVLPVGPPSCQRLTLVERTGASLTTVEGEACVFVPLIGRQGWSSADRHKE